MKQQYRVTRSHRASRLNWVARLGLCLICALTMPTLQALNHDEQAVRNNANIRLALAPHVPANQLEVHVHKNFLQVVGFVDNLDQYKRVAEVLEKYRADNYVFNNLKILSVRDDIADEKNLADSVRQILDEHKYKLKGASIAVRNGHIIIGGFVNRHVKIKDISRLVAALPGVHMVDNYLLYKQN